MNDFKLTKHNKRIFFDQLENELEENGVLIISIQNADIGKWSMSRLWRAWMEPTAKFMAVNGCTMPLYTKPNGEPYGKRLFDKNDAHELFTAQHLGVDKNGVRLSWAKKDHDGMRKATQGERFNALFRHNVWCTERGINLFNPRGSEYRMIEQEQNQ